MTTDRMATASPGADDRTLYRVGGLAALGIGIGYVVIIPIYIAVGAPPTGAEAWLTYLAGKTAPWWAILGLSVLTDLLFVPLALTLYRALRRIDRNTMALAAAFMLLFVGVDLAVTWTNYAVLISLADQYAGATDVERTAQLAAATSASVVLSSTLEAVYSIGILAVGILLIGIVSYQSAIGRAAAWLAIATGILGIVAVVGSLLIRGLSAIAILASLLTTIWLFVVGYRLLQMARSGYPLTPNRSAE
jgi:hypothetical protein